MKLLFLISVSTRGFQLWAILSPRRHVELSGDNCDGHN